jgi:hypothetical protein
VRRHLAQRRRNSKLGIFAPRTRAFSRACDRVILIERTLARRDLGNSLIDRRLPALFDGRTGGTLKELALSTLTFGACFLAARSAARDRWPAGAVAVPIRRSVVVW